MNAPPVLVLTGADLRELLSLDDHLLAAETAFRLLGEDKTSLPPPVHIHGVGGDFHIKSAMLGLDRPYVAIKTNGNFPDNRERHGLPTIQGAVLLCDGATGSPLAFLDSIEITSARTGAASALAARHLASPEASTATICGCGTQGHIQLASIANVLPITRVFAWDKNLERAKDFAMRSSADLSIEVMAVEQLDEATLKSDVIVTCTTSTLPYLGPQSVRPGTFIAAVGADNPAKQEITNELVAKAVVFADVASQALTMGDFHHALEAGMVGYSSLEGELADLVTGRCAGRADDKEIYIFDSTGTAVQDVAAAAAAYERALDRGAGLPIALA